MILLPNRADGDKNRPSANGNVIGQRPRRSNLVSQDREPSAFAGTRRQIEISEKFPIAMGITSNNNFSAPLGVETMESSSGPIALLPQWYSNAICMQKHITCSYRRLPSILHNDLKATGTDFKSNKIILILTCLA